VIKLFNAYRALALTVGVFLLLGTASVLMTGKLESWVLYHVSTDSAAYKIGHPLGLVWILHGWFYIAYLIVTFILTRRAGWPLEKFALMLLAGLIPVTIFFVERWASKQLREQIPELSGPVSI
jgi:integral membrane protein